jgi:hypothetical protein
VVCKSLQSKLLDTCADSTKDLCGGSPYMDEIEERRRFSRNWLKP